MSSTAILPSLAKSAWQTMLFLGLAEVVLGVMILVWPDVSVAVAAVLFGIFLLISGVMQLAFAFGTHVDGGVRVLAFITGALTILLGLLCFRSLLQSILLLAIWIGIGWIFRGITLLLAAITDENMPARGWEIVVALLNLVAGIIVVVSPLKSIAALAILTGIALIVIGIIEVVAALGLRSDLKKLA